MALKGEVETAIENFFAQIDANLVAQIEKASLPFVGALKDAPGIADALAFYTSIKTKLLAVVQAAPDEPTEQDAADALATAITDQLKDEGVTAVATKDAGVTLTFARTEAFSPTGKDAAQVGDSLGSFLKLEAAVGLKLAAVLAAELTVAKDGKVTLADNVEPEVKIRLTGDLSITKGEAGLGFVGVTFKDAVPFDPANPDDPAAHELTATVAVDVTQTDGKLGADTTFAATGTLDLDFASTADGAFEFLPTIAGELIASIGVDKDGVSTKSFDIKDVTIDLGTYFKLVEDAAQSVADVFNAAPFGTLVDVATSPVPVINGINSAIGLGLDTVGGTGGQGDGKVTLADLVVYVREDLRSIVEPWYKVVTIIDVLRKLGAIDTSQTVTLGSIESTKDGPKFTASDDDIFSILTKALQDSGKIDDATLNYLTDFDSDAMSKQVALSAAKVGESKGFSFGLLENPALIADLLLGTGEPVSFVEYDVPPLTFEQHFSKFFPIIGPLGAEISGAIRASLDFDLGYDSYGFDKGNPFLGFYLSTPAYDAGTRPQQGAGAPPPFNDEQFEPIGALDVELRGGAGIGFGGGSFTVGVSFLFGLYAFLNGDTAGRYHLTAKTIDCIFDPIGGVATVEANARLVIDFAFFTYRKNFPIASQTLGSFTAFECPHPDFVVEEKNAQGLATLLDNGDVRLNVGADAKDRAVPDEVDGKTIYKPIQMADAPEQESYLIARARDAGDGGIAGGGGDPVVVADKLDILAFGFTQRIATGRIVASFGAGNDALIIQSDVTQDSLVDGGDGDDNLVGGGGSDTLSGGSGEDVLSGGDGNDSLTGGNGLDQLSGGQGADTIDGGTESDTVDYSAANTAQKIGVRIAISQDGSATSSGGEADGDKLVSIENVIGTAFADRIDAKAMTEKVYLEGGEGNDTLFGGSGNDILMGGVGADKLNGGGGVNATSYITSWAGVDVNLNRVLQYYGEADGDSLIKIQAIQGSTFNDTLVGNADANQFDAGDGDDTIDGGRNTDLVLAGGGDDLVFARGDGDTLDGGAGVDTLSYARATKAVSVNLLRSFDADGKPDPAAGPDTIIMAAVFAGQDGGFSTFENLVGSRYDDTLVGDNGDNRIEGGTGNDWMAGAGGDDTLIGGIGADTMYGAAGRDLADYAGSGGAVEADLTAIGKGADADGDRYSGIEDLRGSAYGDVLSGDDGDNVIDPYIAGRKVSDAVIGGAGTDTLKVDYSTVDADIGGGVSGRFVYSNEGRLTHGDGDGGVLDRVDFTGIERIDFTGTRFADRMIAGNGDDRMYGGSGDDSLAGGIGSDVIYGAQGSDTVSWGFSRSGDSIGGGMIDDGISDAGSTAYRGNGDPDVVFFLNGGSGVDTLAINLTGITEDVTIHGGDTPGSDYKYYNLRLASGAAATRFERLSVVVTDRGNDRISQAGRVDNDFRSGDGSDRIDSGLGRDTIDGGLAVRGLSDSYSFDRDGNRVYQLESLTAFRKAPGDTLFLDYSTLEEGRRVISTGFTQTAYSVDYPVFGTRVLRSEVQGNTGRYVTLEDSIYGDTGIPRPIPGDALDDVQFTNIERLNVIGSSGNDIITGTDTVIDTLLLDRISGDRSQASGSDELHGADGDDYLYGRTGDDTIDGGDGNDVLVGTTRIVEDANSTPSDYDRGEIDQLTGGAGADRFVLGDSFGAFYTRQTPEGDGNHGVITDYSAADGDVIQLYGTARSYFLREVDGDTQIYMIGGRVPELIGIVKNVTGMNLLGKAFDYVDPLTGDPSDPPIAKQQMKAAPPETVDQATTLRTASLSAEQKGGFTVTQNSSPTALTGTFDAASGATKTSVALSGSAEAFGTFSGDPFGLGKGVILSTGRVTDLPGENTVQHSGTLITSVPVTFDLIGRVGNTDIYRADLSHLGIDINSIRLSDSNSTQGGGTGIYSGFDVGAVALSNKGIDKQDFAALLAANNDFSLDDPSILPRLDVFDFSADAMTYNAGKQRSTGDFGGTDPNLSGAINLKLVNEAGAQLDRFGEAGGIGTGAAIGALTLGDGGSIAFDLNQTVSTAQPLYLYVAESGGSGETVVPTIQVSADGVEPSGDLSSDLGTEGLPGDTTQLTYRFTPKAGDTGFAFDAVFFTEELPEYDGTKLSDLFSIKLNGVEIGRLSNGTELSLKSLVYSGSGDLILNAPGSGPLADQIRADAYTRMLTIAGQVIGGQENVLTIEVKDGRDAYLDSGLLIKDGSLRTFVRPDVIVRGPDSDAQPGDRLTIDLSLPEGARPTKPVQVTATPGDDIDLGNGPGKPVTITFDPDGPLTTTIDATIVAGAEPGTTGQIDYSVTSDDPNYDGKPVGSSVVDIVEPAPQNDPFLLFERLSGDVVPGFTSGNDAVDVTGRPGPTTLHIAGTGTGKDSVKGFGGSDILIVDEPIVDSNKDGIITFGRNGVLDFDGPDKGTDTVRFVGGPRSLRSIGTDDDGPFAYADASTRQKGWKEGMLGDDALAGDAKDRRGDVFLFDTALDVNWGSDSIASFGRKDRVVTTTALYDADGDGRIELGSGGRLVLTGNGTLDPSHLGDVSATAPFGTVRITATGGASVAALDLVGSYTQNGHAYYVYELADGDAAFAD
ncbi:choice-of-anchor L domain-containing protein [Sphingomonas sp. Leaf62]|uniref:choice-of-anchor L domain-containing protein n=1 Tax=Sphingomonas sp. Leaf62 TaxID=1736228 RepID=UPI0006F2B3EC|nr:choice-of-anchor L domain-containing protein [Sphingomonas sp. Leaf62]KQN73886.1 hypothetical protein ASE91_17445 [Sphingomonas sp. Leaf62]